MKQNRTAIILGATGLVGSNLLKQLLKDDSFSVVKIFVRRTTGINDLKIEEHIVDFNDISSFKDNIAGDVLFSCMGTTIKQAGSKEAQYLVDYTYQYEFARTAKDIGVQTYVLVSSANAKATSSIFYSRIKGELEDAVKELQFPRTVIFQPSILVGLRNEKRFGESIGVKIANAMGKIIPPLKKYRGIKGEEVAQAMLAAYNKPFPNSVIVFKLDEIFKLLF